MFQFLNDFFNEDYFESQDFWKVHKDSTRKAKLSESCDEKGDVYHKVTFGGGEGQVILLSLPRPNQQEKVVISFYASSADVDPIHVNLAYSNQKRRPWLIETGPVQLNQKEWKRLELNPADINQNKKIKCDTIFIRIAADWDDGYVLFRVRAI